MQQLLEVVMPEYLINVFLGIWLLALSFGFFWIFRKFSRLTKDVDGDNLVKVLEKVLDKEDLNAKNLKNFEKTLEEIKKKDFLHIQRVGVLKFNPFKDTGGNSSFAIALLDGNNDGFILTGLHTRERTRVYAKEIVGGRSEIDLSEEETRVLGKALQN